jgi:hypothetical protein
LILWKYIAIGLAVLLGLSYIGFAYIYRQNGGIYITGIGSAGPQPRVVTLLRNQNVTGTWNMSVDVLGYKTGFLYCQVFQTSVLPPTGPISYVVPAIDIWFQVDNMKISNHIIGITGPTLESHELDLEGSRMWVIVDASNYWIVISLSLYLRD